MSSKEKIEQWEESLPPHHRQHIQDLISEIRSEMDKVIQGEERIDYLIDRLMRLCDEIGLPREETSVFIKHKLQGIVSERTLERHLPEDRKRKHKAYERYQEIENDSVDFQQPVTVSSDGSESYTKPDGTEGQREYEPYEGEPEPIPSIQEVNEQATEIALSLADEYAKKSKEQEISLREARQIADDKDKRIYQLEMQAGELEMTIADLKKVPPQAKDIDKTEDLQIENDNLKQTIIELQEALRANVKASGFTQASHLPKRAWIAAVNALNFYRRLNSESRTAIEHNDPWHKIEFDCAADGQLTNPSKQ